MEIFIFAVFFFLSVSISDSKNGPTVYRPLLFLTTVFFIVWAGVRTFIWPDTAGYVLHFINSTPTLFDFSFNSNNYLYSEKGYYLLASIIRTFSDNPVIYLTTIAGIGLFFIYRGLNKYCIFLYIQIIYIYHRFWIS